MLEPLLTRTYSIASNPKMTPNSIEILVGKIEYQTSAVHISSTLRVFIVESRRFLILSCKVNQTLKAVKNIFKEADEDAVSPRTVLPKDRTVAVQGTSSSFLSNVNPGNTVHAQVLSKVRFRLPSEVDAPIVMVGLGTGIAPFISFIKDLIHEKIDTGHVRRKSWLILEVRTPDHLSFRK